MGVATYNPLPTIVVRRTGMIVDAVEWHSADGNEVRDLTDMHVGEVAVTIKQGELPTVFVSFHATLVERQTP